MEKEYIYQFYNRSKEKEDIKTIFEKSIKDKNQSAVFIRGKKGIGKTRLVTEFKEIIKKDIDIRSEMPSFNAEKNIISYQCEPKNAEPYLPFIEITKLIQNRIKIFEILYNIFQVVLAIFQVNDTLNALKNLANSVYEDKNDIKLKQKEVRLFNQYRRFIKKRSSKSPLIIIIEDVQWIDLFSLKLIQKLVSDRNQFWGMIILEQDDVEIPEELNDEFNRLISANRFVKIDLFALDKSFPSALLSSRFGENFFSSDENDLLYTISEGNPGKLIDYIKNNCIGNHFLYEETGIWKKKEDFKECIKPVNQKLLELIISLYEDKELSEGESRMIKKMAHLWGINISYVNQTINMVKDVMDSGFRVNQILDSGILSNNSFSVTDSSNKRFIIEHVKVNSQDCETLFKNRGFENKHLLEVLSYKVCENGVLVIWDYYIGKKSRQVITEEFEKHINNSIQKFIQVSEGLAELHRNSVAHGFLNPRSVIETGEGKYQLATFNHDIFKYIVKVPEDNHTNDIHFLAPEQLKGEEPSIHSDIFSLGVLFYNSLTNKYPFHGKSGDDLINSIRNDKIEFKGYLESLIPTEIIEILRTSLSFNPKDRYSSSEEFYHKLKGFKFVAPPPPPPHPPQTPPPTNYLKYLIIGSAVVMVVLGIINFDKIKNLISGTKIIIKDESTITVESVNETNNKLKLLDPAIIEYLLQYNISNKSNLTILNLAQFDVLHHPSKKEINKPYYEFNVKITNGEFGYEMEIKVTDNSQNGSTRKKKVTFRDPSELLNGKLEILTSDLATKRAKGNYLTKDWDAFYNFYKGDLNWIILNKNKADEFFRRSISIDSAFLLPKLRLSKIYRFDGKNSEAINLLRIINASIDKLSMPDSLRAVALWNTLNGNTRKAIINYKDLISYLPAQKEPYYELAEAYFEMRDIDNAIINYRKALELDPDFTLALNHLGYSLSHSGQHDSALYYFKKYVKLDGTANSYDSYGDGFFAYGMLDSAKWAKLKGLELDPNLDYLYSSLAYINIREGKLKEAESNLNKYLSSQTSPEKISTGLTNKAYIYLIRNEYKKALDTCLRAKSLYDSQDLVTRNHILHWVLSKVYFETKNTPRLSSELNEMKKIIDDYNINEFNYNVIYKFYDDIMIHQLINQNKYDEAKALISIFDNEMYNKVKDWSSPFDIAFLNTEFGKLYLGKNKLDLARERFNKALGYNPNYALAHLYLSKCCQKLNLPDEAAKHLDEYKRLMPNADPDYISILN